MNEVAVIGAGAWGIALATQAARAGASVTLWARSHVDALARDRVSPRLPGHRIPAGIHITADMPTATLALLAVPTQYMRAVAAHCRAGAFAVCAKGIEAGTGRLPLEIVADLHPATPACVLTGPNLAAEIAAGLPAACVAAGVDPTLRAHVAAAIGTARFRIYGNSDAIGAQVGGAAKNVIAIAAGAVIGAGLGENARAALVTRGLAEIARLAEALGGDPRTVMGLSGLGDLALTCASPASRNYAFGVALGQGRAPAAILSEADGVTEGVTTAPALLTRAGGLDLPVCRAVAGLLAGALTLEGAIAALLGRPTRDE